MSVYRGQEFRFREKILSYSANYILISESGKTVLVLYKLDHEDLTIRLMGRYPLTGITLLGLGILVVWFTFSIMYSRLECGDLIHVDRLIDQVNDFNLLDCLHNIFEFWKYTCMHKQFFIRLVKTSAKRFFWI